MLILGESLLHTPPSAILNNQNSERGMRYISQLAEHVERKHLSGASAAGTASLASSCVFSVSTADIVAWLDATREATVQSRT